ncbi:hypothetical protein KXL68_004831 [Salmonella enterica]|nr:hypothetical protein [Salmonella enterica]
MVIPPYVRLLLVAVLVLSVPIFRADGVLRHTCSGLLEGCLIVFVVFVCCTIQHITTYKVDIIPRRSTGARRYPACCCSAA